MPTSVTLRILNGPRQGEIFVFDQRAIVVIGRNTDCQLCFSEDRLVSHYHCLLEINPPSVVMRELGSRNGTYINGHKYGGRRKQIPLEILSTERVPEIELQDDDEIRIGKSTLRLTIDRGAEPALASAGIVSCQRCGQAVANEVATYSPSGVYLCPSCREQQALSHSKNIIPDHETVKKLGKGGMSDVYLVRDTRTGQLAALKVLRPPRTKSVVQDARELFRREIDNTKKLEHPHVVRFLNSYDLDGVFYLLVEFCAEGTLSQLLEKRGGALPLREAAPLLLGALEGLAAAHQRGIVHRDIKPANILLADAQGTLTAKIADMGLAKSFIIAGFSHLTPPGFWSGSVPFMPREQLLNYRFVGPASDVWSMGATCYYLLTGAYPRNHRGLSSRHVVLYGTPVPIRTRNEQIPLPVAEVIDHSLLLNPADRYQNASEMLEAFTQALHRL